MPEPKSKYLSVPYLPRLKTKLFLPNPVAVNGIPSYADSSTLGSKVKGTSAWEEWWEEQIYYCLNGYTTGGIFIPGRFYFYLNYCIMSSVDKGNHYPSYIDLHQEFFDLFEEAKKIHWGIITVKGRRKGIEQPHSEIIITDKGITTMGELKVGDKVQGTDGYLYNVKNKFYQGKKDVYEIKLLDGRNVKCGKNHLWEIWNRTDNKKRKKVILSTEELIQRGMVCNFKVNNGKNTIYKNYIKSIKSVEFPKKKLPLEPYLLGCLLGDGTINKIVKISSKDKEILDRISNIVGKEYTLKYDKWSNCNYRITYNYVYNIKYNVDKGLKYDDVKYGFHPLINEIKKLNLNVKCENKFIPEIYKYSSKEQRLEIVRGLMDTDGSVSTKGGIDFSNKSRRLIFDLAFILRSLGINCTLKDKIYSNYVYRLYIKTNQDIFHLKRKLKRIVKDKRRYDFTAIVEVNKLNYKEECSCITVDSKDSLYLTKDFIPTHNTYDVVGGIFDYGFRFGENYRAAVVAGMEEHADQFFDKLKLMHNLKPPEFRMHLLKDTKEEIKAGWQEKTDEGYITKGTGNIIEYKVAYTTSKIFRGSGYNDIAFEEGGQFPLLMDTYDSSVDCLKVGDIMYGTPYIIGTVGKIHKDMQGMEEMWHEADSYHLLRYYVPANRFFFPCVGGYKDKNGEVIEDVPNLTKFTTYQRMGCEDIVRAEERIKIRRAELLKKRNKEAYFSYVQENPLTIEEAFSVLISNNFDPETLNDASIRIASYGKNKYGIYKLEWVLDDKGDIEQPYSVIAKSVADKDIETNGNYCYILHMPKNQYRNLDVAGVDSYNLDQAKTTKSLGAMLVYRCKHEIPNLEHSLPIAVIRNRPRRKEMFFENCLMLAVLYDLRYNVLVDIGSDLIIEYFKNMGCSRYLAPRPKRFDAPETQQSHNIGVKLTPYSKPRMIGIMQRDILDNMHNCWYSDLVRELQNYDEKTMDSDCDLADAYGYALMQEASRNSSIIDEEEMKKNDPFKREEWKEDSNGNMVPINSDNESDHYVIIGDESKKLNINTLQYGSNI